MLRSDPNRNHTTTIYNRVGGFSTESKPIAQFTVVVNQNRIPSKPAEDLFADRTFRHDLGCAPEGTTRHLYPKLIDSRTFLICGEGARKDCRTMI